MSPYLDWFVKDAITNFTGWVAWTKYIYNFKVLLTRNLSWRCGQGWFLPRPLFLACRCPSSPWVLTWLSLVCLCPHLLCLWRPPLYWIKPFLWHNFSSITSPRTLTPNTGTFWVTGSRCWHIYWRNMTPPIVILTQIHGSSQENRGDWKTQRLEGMVQPHSSKQHESQDWILD